MQCIAFTCVIETKAQSHIGWHVLLENIIFFRTLVYCFSNPKHFFKKTWKQNNCSHLSFASVNSCWFPSVVGAVCRHFSFLRFFFFFHFIILFFARGNTIANTSHRIEVKIVSLNAISTELWVTEHGIAGALTNELSTQHDQMSYDPMTRAFLYVIVEKETE